MAFQRGLDEIHEQNQHNIIRDTRPLSTKIHDFFKNPHGVFFILIGMIIVSLFIAFIVDLVLIAGICAFCYCFFRRPRLPFKMPMRSHRKDYNDCPPGSHKPRQARGIYFFGNDKKSKDELWFSNEDMRTHVLIFGSTGSGKTEALISIAYNALIQASGFIYVDGKGDNSLYAKIFSMVRSMGRTDDLLLINFMTGARDIIGPQEKRLSNTLNPFASGSSSMLSQLVVSMMDQSSATPDGDMWKGRAIAFVEALMKVLVAMRDANYILLDANSIRNYFHLNRIESMVVDKIFVRDGQEPVNIEFLPPTVMEPINNYLFNLPGYNKEKKHKQVSQVLEQHGFITMQLTRVFTSLADTYGHILRTKLAEVDLKDVVLNRRILLVLLPALEKSPDELSNLGKVIVSTLRAMMAAGLGEHVEGDYADLISSKPTNSETPYLCILDEYGYYAVQGFAVVPAQARSLGFSVVFAGQDLPAFQKSSKEEAASIGANTNIKICMKLEDPTETWDFFMKTAGESYVTHVDQFQVDAGSIVGTNYLDGKGARLEKRARVDLLDLKEQREGEGHIFFKSKIVRYRTFYANPKPIKRLRLNHFLKIDTPTDGDVQNMLKHMHRFESLLADGDFVIQADMGLDDDIEKVVTSMNENNHGTTLERAVLALKNFGIGSTIPANFFNEDLDIDDMVDESLNVFTGMRLNDHLEAILLENETTAQFRQPILNRSYTRDQVEYIQRLCGRSGQEAMNVAIEVISDMNYGTQYPPEYKPHVAPNEVSATIYDVIDAIALQKNEENK